MFQEQKEFSKQSATLRRYFLNNKSRYKQLNFLLRFIFEDGLFSGLSGFYGID